MCMYLYMYSHYVYIYIYIYLYTHMHMAMDCIFGSKGSIDLGLCGKHHVTEPPRALAAPHPNLRHAGLRGPYGSMFRGPTWTPKVCKIVAF